MRLELDLAIPADARLLRRTRQVVSSYLDDLGVDPDDSSDVVLALDEACVNVIRHAYRDDGEDAPLHVAAELGCDEVLVEVFDNGIGFEPRSSNFELPPAEAVSGRGLGLMRELMTSVDIEPGPGDCGTRVRMRKQLR